MSPKTTKENHKNNLTDTIVFAISGSISPKAATPNVIAYVIYYATPGRP